MASNSKIEWTDSTWNPVTGCTKVSTGCKNCYALTFAERWRGTPGHPFEQGFDLRLWPERLNLPLRWKEPRRIFVNSMSDLFHDEVPDVFIEKIFETMTLASQHIFQILTKRHERMHEWVNARYSSLSVGHRSLKWPTNVWIGVSVESQLYTPRIKALQRVPTKNRFLSLEPLVGPIHLSRGLLKGIGWVIVGGESGWNARPMKPEWVKDIKDACQATGTPFFFKQWGTHDSGGNRVGKGKAGRLFENRIWSEEPVGFSTINA